MKIVFSKFQEELFPLLENLPFEVKLSAFLPETMISQNLYTGIGAVTCQGTNIQVTRAALTNAPRYGRPVSWKNQVEKGMTMIRILMMWNRLMVKLASTPPGPMKGIRPRVNSGTYGIRRNRYLQAQPPDSHGIEGHHDHLKGVI
jgi:hypothetical protein